MKVRMLFADQRRRISDVKHLPVNLYVTDDEVSPHRLRWFELRQDSQGKPLYTEVDSRPPQFDHVARCKECRQAEREAEKMCDCDPPPAEVFSDSRGTCPRCRKATHRGSLDALQAPPRPPTG